jgi:translation initiation factor 2 alpha subunit (eIF-2alpha)
MNITTTKSEASDYVVLDNSETKITFQISLKTINEGNKKTTSFKLNEKLHKSLKICATLYDRQEGELINEAIADLLVKYNLLKITD